MGNSGWLWCQFKGIRPHLELIWGAELFRMAAVNSGSLYTCENVLRDSLMLHQPRQFSFRD